MARWQELDRIFQSAIELSPESRSQYIREACGDDAELFDQLNTLLRHHESTRSIDISLLRDVRTLTRPDAPALWPKERVDKYEIVRLVANGGMGRVYLARDVQLGRHVALKMLRPHAVGNLESSARFVQEARAASALNHPNIVTVFELGEHDGVQFIASEYVDGTTLRERILHRKLTLDEALDICRQTAIAIAAAHKAGIVHRDLKPENIIIRPDGLVKVVDFGLAAISAEAAGDASAVRTQEGVILGTLPYMSPEQTRGEETDASTDVWSLGVILCELVSGRHPFAAPTGSEILAKIREGTPSLSELPRALRPLVRAALEPRAGNRTLTASAFSDALNRVSGRSSRWRIRLATAVSLVVVALVATLVAWSGRIASMFGGPQDAELTLLTDLGNVVEAALSPDGRYLAYVVRDESVETLRIRQLETRLDRDLIGKSPVTYNGLAFSPDGDYVYYGVYDTPDVASLFRIAAFGAASPRKLVNDADTPPALSPDGSRLAFVRIEPRRKRTSVLIASSDGSAQRVLATRDGVEIFRERGISWNPDGTAIAVTAAVQRAGKMRETIIGIETENGRQYALTDLDWWAVRRLSWTTEGLFAAAVTDTSAVHKIFRVTRTKSINITKDLHAYEALTGLPSARALVAVQQQRIAGVWAAPASRPEDIHPLTTAAGRYAFVTWISPRAVVTQATVFNRHELWVLGDDGTRQRNLTEHGAIETNVRGCPGTDYVLFLSNRTGDWKIWRTGRDGSNPVQITSGPGVDGSPSCSPDGKWVIFSSYRRGTQTLWKTSIDGGEAVPFVTEVSYHPEVSPDGRLLVCAYYDAQAHRDGPVAVLDMASRRPVARFRTISDQAAIRWTRDSRSLTYIRTAGGVSNIYVQPITGGPERQLTHFKSERLFAFEWSPDGAKIAYIRGMEAHDAVRMTFK